MLIHHIVLLKLTPDCSLQQIEEMDQALAALCGKVEGLLSYHSGPNVSPEAMHQGYNFGFVMTFPDAAARDHYLPHPDHEKVKAMIGKLLAPDPDSVLVYDF